MVTVIKVLMVVNPISGGKDKTPFIDYVTKTLKREKYELNIFETSGERDKEELRKVVEDYQPNRIFSVGGDGTIKLIAEILQDDSIPISIFPAGSANGLAENLNLPTSIEELTKIALSDNFISLDSITVNHELCLHIADVGLNAALIKNYEEGNIRGKLGYLIHSIPTLIKSEFPFHFEIEREGKFLHKKGVLLAIANARRYGTGSTINPNGKYDDGLFEILIFKKFDIPGIIKTFWDSNELDEDFLEIFSASKAIIRCNKNIPFQIDGEYRGEVREVHAEISPIKIKITVPEKKSPTFR